MRGVFGLGVVALFGLSGVAWAVPAPGPELGSDAGGLIAVAAMVVGYGLFRYVRARRT